MEQIQRTILSAHLQTTKMLNRPFTVLPNSTLNSKFNIFPTEVPHINEYPSLAYIAIGNKGASYDIAANGYVLMSPVPHLPRDCSLYNFIPFVVRPEATDLTAAARANYRLRVPILIGGVPHVAYYLKVLPLSTVAPSVELRNVNNGIITTTPFDPVLSDLSPTPPVISNVNINNPNGNYLVSTAKITFILNQQDVNDIMDACNLIYGDIRYAVINEIALCTGIDRILSGTINGVATNYTESVTTQVAAFISQYHALTATTTQVQLDLDVGSVETLLV